MPFLDLADRVREVRQRIEAAVRRGGHGQTVTIVAVTKTHGPDALEAAWDAGLHDIGENKVQEALGKMDQVRHAFRWHLIGHLQRNKVKHLARFHLLHSLDRDGLSDSINELGAARQKPFDALMQLNIAGETTKGGFNPEAFAWEVDRLRGMPGIDVRGVMTMAPFDADERTLRRVFSEARSALTILRDNNHHEATALSMGMSQDYEIAVEEGATLVRLGTVLFGART
jgi:PLP dependent protein